MNGYGLHLQQAGAIRLTSSLRQAIEVLGLPNAQFVDFLAFKSRTNPFIELRLEQHEGRARIPKDRPPPHGAARAPGAGPFPEGVAQPAGGLVRHVLAQAGLLIEGEAEHRIAAHLIEALEPTGWLGRSVEDIAQDAACTPAEVEDVLRKLQQAEPPGLFARTLQECLTLQAIDAGLMEPVMACTLANLPLIAAGQLAEVARRGDTTTEEIASRLRQIRSFDPKPGARFGEDHASPVLPDLRVTRGDEGWIVDVRNPMVDAIVVRPPEKVVGTGALSAAENDLLREARALRHAAERRDRTMVAVAAEIVRRQEAFLRDGPRALRPLRLVDVADAIGVHESTVSRITSDRHIATPRGVLPLRDFFSRSLGEDPDGTEVSAAAVRERIRAIIEAEDSVAPVSDAQIAGMLEASGCRVARRTVAKYRDQLGLGSAAARKQAKPRAVS